MNFKKLYFAILFFLGIVFISGTRISFAQNNSLHRQQVNRNGYTPPLTMQQANMIRAQPVEPRKISMNDIIQIRVNELARMTVEGESQRRKNASINAVLLDWVRLNGLNKLEAVGNGANDPTVQGQLQQLYRAEGEIETTERLTFNIAAKVADVRPNGNLVLEAHKEIRVNQEVLASCVDRLVQTGRHRG